jgi:putative transposase
MTRKSYPSDLTDEQWSLIEPMIPPEPPGGRTREVDMREVFNGIQYLLRTSCSWRQLPHDVPPWGTVHYYYRRFRRDGTWERIHDRLREQVRIAAGREAQPRTAILDAQSVRTTEKGGFTGMTPAKK